MDLTDFFDKIHSVEGQSCKIVHNAEKNGETIRTLLEIYFKTKASDVEGLEEFVNKLLQSILARLEAVENGASSTLTDNPNEMDFVELGNISVIRGIWDDENQRVYC